MQAGDTSPAAGLLAGSLKAAAAFDVAGRRLVAGLHWEPIKDVEQFRKERKAVARRLGFDTAVLWRPPGNASGQIGFGLAIDGATAGATALAPSLAANLGENWLAVLPVGDGRYALVAVPKGAAIERDFVGDQDQIARVWNDIVQKAANFNQPYTRRFAPPALGLPGAEELPEDALYVGGGRQPKLESIGSSSDRFTGGGKHRLGTGATVGVLLALLMGGFLYYQKTESDKLAAHKRAVAQQRADDAKKAAMQPKPAAEAAVLDPEWLTQPSATDFIQACSDTMDKFPLSLAGWTIKTFDCTSGKVAVTYQREGETTTLDFIEAAQAQLGITPTSGESLAIVSLPVYLPAPRTEKALGASQAKATFMSHFQAIGAGAPLTAVPPPPPTKPNEPPPVRAWSKWTYVVVTPTTPVVTRENPSLLFSHFDMPGLRVSQLKADRTDAPPFLNWTVTGALYAQ